MYVNTVYWSARQSGWRLQVSKYLLVALSRAPLIDAPRDRKRGQRIRLVNLMMAV